MINESKKGHSNKSYEKWKKKRQRLGKKIEKLQKEGWENSLGWKVSKKKTRGDSQTTKIRREVGRWLTLKKILKGLKPPAIDIPPPRDNSVLYVKMFYEKKGGANYPIRDEWNISDYGGNESKKAVEDMIEDAEKWIEEKEREGFQLEETNISEWEEKLENEEKNN